MHLSGIAAIVLLASVSSAWAQPMERPRHMPAPSSGAAVRHVAPKPPSAPPPAPSSVQAAPPVATPPPGQAPPRSPFEAGPFTYAPRYTPGQRPRLPYYGAGGYYGYGVPYYEDVESPRVDESRNQPDNQLSMEGGIFFDVEPRSADVYVDGFFVGRADDFALNGLTLRAGRHWIDLRAAGYETLTLPINITAAQAVRYRGALSAARTTPASTELPSGPQTMYVITGCYAGNRPPVPSALPPGCDISRVRELPGSR
jgi:PEGA domain